MDDDMNVIKIKNMSFAIGKDLSGTCLITNEDNGSSIEIPCEILVHFVNKYILKEEIDIDQIYKTSVRRNEFIKKLPGSSISSLPMIAFKHQLKMEDLFPSSIDESVKSSIIYNGTIHVNYKKNNTLVVIQLIDSDVVTCICNECRSSDSDKTAVLNFANWNKPGGGFSMGGIGQEEALCHASTLFPVLVRHEHGYYKYNKNHNNFGLYCDRALYTPNIIFVHEDSSVTCDVITCSAPDRSMARHFSIHDEENYEALRSRIKYILDAAVRNDVKVLILGAFGCGRSGQDPKVVAKIFLKYLSTTHCNAFKKVIFAIPNTDDGNFSCFNSVFAEYVPDLLNVH